MEKDMKKDMENGKEIYDRFIRHMGVLGPDEGTVSGIRVSLMKKRAGSRIVELRILTASSAAAALILAAMLFPSLMPFKSPASPSQQPVDPVVLYVDDKIPDGSRLYEAYRHSLERRQHIMEKIQYASCIQGYIADNNIENRR